MIRCSSSILCSLAGAVCAGALCGGWFAWPEPISRAALHDAQTEANAQRWKVAQQILDRYLGDAPHDPEAQLLMARIRAAQGDLEGCMDFLKKVSSKSRFGP